MNPIPARECLGIVAAFTSMAIAIPSASLAQIYHPLHIGSQWEYFSVEEGDQTMTITGELTVLGTVARIRLQQEMSQTYENYWTMDAAGNLYLHGARNYDGDFELAYRPPIKFVSSPLYLGKSWVTQDIHLFYLDGTPWGGEPFDYPLEVYTEGMVSVPAGEFYAYGVGSEYGPLPAFASRGSVYDLRGRRLTGESVRQGEASEWYAENVGEVLMSHFTDESLGFKLVSYDLPVPVQSLSWGRLRTLFR
jgi:hypothetical protein